MVRSQWQKAEGPRQQASKLSVLCEKFHSQGQRFLAKEIRPNVARDVLTPAEALEKPPGYQQGQPPSTDRCRKADRKRRKWRLCVPKPCRHPTTHTQGRVCNVSLNARCAYPAADQPSCFATLTAWSIIRCIFFDADQRHQENTNCIGRSTHATSAGGSVFLSATTLIGYRNLRTPISMQTLCDDYS
jgi:hypothetical protein